MSSASGATGEPPYLVLVNADASTTYDLLRKKTITVARAGFNGDLEIHGDKTVSRSHAEISCIKKTIDGQVKLFMQVLDKNSKFGTYVNEGITSNRRIECGNPVVLSPGDSIRFGLMDSGLFQLKTRAYNVCMSTLKKPAKMILDKAIKQSKGISIQRDFGKDTTHLCMNEITVTEKALLSLAHLQPIVTVSYFVNLYTALLPGSSMELPFSDDYLPHLLENVLNRNSMSFDINPKRKGLFAGKTFICCSEEQINSIGKVVKAAGGNVLHYVDCQNMSVNDILKNDAFILMQPSIEVEIDDRYKMMLEELQNMNERPIPETEIALAMIFASTERHCNPKCDISLINGNSQRSVPTSQAPMVLAQDTEEVKLVENSQMFSVNCVPDSLPPTNGCYKRPSEVIMDSDVIMMPNKRAVLSDEVNVTNSMDIDVENMEPSKSIFGLKKTTFVDSCVSQVPSSQDISKENDFPSSLKVTGDGKNKSNTHTLNSDNNLCSDSLEKSTNNVPSDSVENTMISNKRKISNVWSVSNNEDNELFDYMDIDEVELPKKKPKCQLSESTIQPIPATEQYTDSITFPIPSTSSSIKNKQSTFEKPKPIQAVDPCNIMDVLADVKGTGQFIDACKSPDISLSNLNRDPEYDYLMDSVIIQTINMVKSRSTLTQNSFQGSNSNLKNFKKFKKKGPAMRIPHIVPLEISLID